MAIAHTVVRLPVTPSHFGSQVRSWSFLGILGTSLLSFVAGTSVSVYGIRSWFKMGNLGATYAIDGTIISSKTYNITGLFEVGDGPGDEANFVYFSQEDLPAGDHTLVVNITFARHLDFILDYITYKPSFDTLLSMPLLNNTTTTIPSVSTDSYPSSAPQPSQVGTPQRLTVAIVGGIIGALALAAILGTWLFLERRKARQTENISQYQDGVLRIMFIIH